MFCRFEEVALRAQRVLQVGVVSLLAAISVFASSSALAQVAVVDAIVGTNTAAINTQLTTLQTFLATQLTPVVPPIVVPPVYLAPITPMLPVLCPVTLNAAAMLRITPACTAVNAAITGFNTAQGAFETQMALMTAEATKALATGSVTTANVLTASLHLQAVQAHQANLIGRHMANVEWLKQQLKNAETEFMHARAIMKYGPL